MLLGLVANMVGGLRGSECEGRGLSMFRLKSEGVDATRAIAAALAALVVAGDVLVLTGELGTGKTVFTQGFGEALGVQDRITSPTFTLVHEHVGRLDLHHVDVYRLTHVDEVFDMALPELLDDGGVTVIEWGDLIVAELRKDYLELELALGDVDDGLDVRWFGLNLVGTTWTDREETVAVAVAPWFDGLR